MRQFARFEPKPIYVIITTVVIMNRYTKLYAWIRKSFGESSFTIDEFRSTFPTSQAPKIIHDLLEEGYLERQNRGEYKALAPELLVDNIVKRDSKTQEVIHDSERKYAFTESSAVSIWTSGYYWTGFTKGFKPLHIKVLKEDLEYWEDFFKNSEASYSFPRESRTLFGFVYMLHPEEEFEFVEKDGRKVIPLQEVVEFCLDNELSYQPALEYLDKHYNIGYKKRTSVET